MTASLANGTGWEESGAEQNMAKTASKSEHKTESKKPSQSRRILRSNPLKAIKLDLARERMSQALTQAKESLKLLQTLEKETVAKAKTLVRNPIPKDRQKLTNERILNQLRRVGVATQHEVEALRERVEKLEALLEGGKKKTARPARTGKHEHAIPQS